MSTITPNFINSNPNKYLRTLNDMNIITNENLEELFIW